MSYNKNWLYNEYAVLFLDATGEEPTAAEEESLKSYLNTYTEGGAKPIYYMAIFRFKRGWNIPLVYFFIARSLKKDFQKDESLNTLETLHKVFARKMLNDAIKAYCKITD
ncbi:MAG: hypothetical protein QM497_05815 [Sulfurimonas sp.]